MNHFQSELRPCPIFLAGSLTGLSLFQHSIAPWRQFRCLLFAIEADQDGQSPDLAGSEGKRDVQGEDDPAVAKGKHGPLLRGAERIVIHVGTPDMATGLARQSVVDSAGQDLGTVWQQKLKDAVAEFIEIPSGLAEKTMKGAEVFVAAQLPGLNNAGKRAPAGTKNPGAGHCPEGGEARLSKAGLKGEQKRSEGPDQQLGQRQLLVFHLLKLKDKMRKKNSLTTADVFVPSAARD